MYVHLHCAPAPSLEHAHVDRRRAPEAATWAFQNSRWLREAENSKDIETIKRELAVECYLSLLLENVMVHEKHEDKSTNPISLFLNTLKIAIPQTTANKIIKNLKHI